MGVPKEHRGGVSEVGVPPNGGTIHWKIMIIRWRWLGGRIAVSHEWCCSIYALLFVHCRLARSFKGMIFCNRWHVRWRECPLQRSWWSWLSAPFGILMLRLDGSETSWVWSQIQAVAKSQSSRCHGCHLLKIVQQLAMGKSLAQGWDEKEKRPCFHVSSWNDLVVGSNDQSCWICCIMMTWQGIWIPDQVKRALQLLRCQEG